MNVQGDMFEVPQPSLFEDLEAPAPPHFTMGQEAHTREADAKEQSPEDYPGYQGPVPERGTRHPAPWNPEAWLWEGR